ncbi:hypothetical protein [Virgibacillus sp. YIM 98842]|nr:hypothetical protein [Virgibacillus sp. YIM 98842]
MRPLSKHRKDEQSTILAPEIYVDSRDYGTAGSSSHRKDLREQKHR